MCGSRYILDSNAPLGARALDLGEVYPQLFGPLPGCHRGIGLTYTLGYLTGHLSRGVLHALRGLSGLVSHLSYGALCLISCSSRGVLRLVDRHIYGVLCSLRDLAHGLLRLPDHLAYGVFRSLVLGRLVERVLDLCVGVDQLLDLRPRFLLGLRELLRWALQLGAVVLELALSLPDRVAVDVLRHVHGLGPALLGRRVMRTVGGSRNPPEQACYAVVFVDLGPVDAFTIADQLPVLALLRGGVEHLWE